MESENRINNTQTKIIQCVDRCCDRGLYTNEFSQLVVFLEKNQFQAQSNQLKYVKKMFALAIVIGILTSIIILATAFTLAFTIDSELAFMFGFLGVFFGIAIGPGVGFCIGYKIDKAMSFMVGDFRPRSILPGLISLTILSMDCDTVHGNCNVYHQKRILLIIQTKFDYIDPVQPDIGPMA